MGKRIILAALALMLGACDSRAQQDQPEPAPVEDAVTAQPVRDEHRALALTPQWLAGRWQTSDGNCGAGDTFFTLSPDGGYGFMGETGRWSLAGSALTITVTEGSEEAGSRPGDRHTTQVTAIGPNEAEFRAETGPPIRVFRCTS